MRDAREVRVERRNTRPVSLLVQSLGNTAAFLGKALGACTAVRSIAPSAADAGARAPSIGLGERARWHGVGLK